MGSLLSCLSTKITSEQTTINNSNIRRLDSFKLEKMLNKNLSEIALVVSSKSEKNSIKYGPNTGDDTKLNDEESTIHGVEGDSIIDLKPNIVDIDEKVYEMEIKISKQEPENGLNDTFSEDIQNLNSIDAYENSSIHTTSVSELENDDQVSENGQYIIRQACSYTFSGNMKSITSENENEASEVCLEDNDSIHFSRALSDMCSVSDSYFKNILKQSIKNPAILIGWEVYVEKMGVGQIIAFHKVKYFSTKFEIQFRNGRSKFISLRRSEMVRSGSNFTLVRQLL